MEKEKKKKEVLIIENRKSRFEYFYLEEFSAGIILTGKEVKSLRNANCSLDGAYCVVENHEIFLRNCSIVPWKGEDINPKRDRKLLLNRSEIDRIERKIIKGVTIVPTKLVVGRKVKLGIAVAQGKNNKDKRDVIKERDAKRELAKY